MFEEMHADGIEPGLMTYNTLVAGCVRAEHPNEALSVFKMMEERNIKRDQVTIRGRLLCRISGVRPSFSFICRGPLSGS